MRFATEDHPIVAGAVERIRALRHLTATTGVKTYRSQSAILESLEPQVLATVALILKRETVTDDESRNRNFK